MMQPLRILHTGLKPARWNVGMTAALVELHRTGQAPDTLRFYCSPPSVLLGRHQNLRREVDVTRCLRQNIEIARRITGGSAAYLSPGILAFDLIVKWRDFGPRLSNSIAWVCTGIAAGIARAGLPARFQPSGSIVIENRLVGGVTATYEGLTFIFQGFIHVDVGADAMVESLAASARKEKDQGFAGTMRPTTSLAAFLGRAPPAEEIIDLVAAGLTDQLRRPFEKCDAEAAELRLADLLVSERLGTRSFVAGGIPSSPGATRTARQRAANGYVEAHVRLAPGADERIDQVWIAGDFSIVPPRAIHDLEDALRGVPIQAAANHAWEVLKGSAVNMFGATPFDIAAVIAAAVKAKPGSRFL
jgi:lipoate-protein ligase A